jgi:hypothetical protein
MEWRSGSRSSWSWSSDVRNENTPKIRFSVTSGEEPVLDLGLV